MLIGLCGKPSSGKSTFFKAATLAEVEIANYPFTTVKSQEGVAFVKLNCVDKEFNKQCNPRFGYCINSQRFVPVKLMDIPGLIPGAHKGLGMGNQFLDDIRQADALIHVIDVSGSTNEKGELVNPGDYNPANDIKFLEEELDYWYLGIIKKGWEKFARTIQQEKLNIIKAIAKQLSGLKVTEEIVAQAIKNLNENPTAWKEEDLLKLAGELRKKSKPIIIAANKLDVTVSEKNLEKLKKEFKDYMIIGCSAEAELTLREAAKDRIIDYIPGDNKFKIINNKISDAQKKALEFLNNYLNKFKTTGIQEILNDSVFRLLKYITVFPGGVNKLEDSDGNVLPDCFLMEPGTTALDFAFRIHEDLGKKFIKAIDVRTKQAKGKEHKLKDRDIIEIVTRK